MEATPIVQNNELKVIAQVTQPLTAKLDLFKANLDGRSANDLPSDSADYSPLAMSPVKTIPKEDNGSSLNKLASQHSQINRLSNKEKFIIKDKEK